MSREYLVQPLPVIPDDGRKALGIFQSDVILRTAIVAGLQDLRDNPALLDYVFVSLLKDPLTKDMPGYGQSGIDAAKDWFLSQDMPVFLNTRVDETQIPCITVAISAGNEDKASLGDVNYETSEEGQETETVYYGPLSPKSYYAARGVITLEVDAEVFPGMVVVDGSGKRHEILDVVDPYTFQIEPGAWNLRDMRIVASRKKVVTLESVEFKEVYEIGCHASGDAVNTTYLYSIVLFILLRYKEALIEARGFERTSISAGPVFINTGFPGHIVFTRMLTVTGFTRQYWPKLMLNPVEGVTAVAAAETYIRDRLPGASLQVVPDPLPPLSKPVPVVAVPEESPPPPPPPPPEPSFNSFHLFTENGTQRILVGGTDLDAMTGVVSARILWDAQRRYQDAVSLVPVSQTPTELVLDFGVLPQSFYDFTIHQQDGLWWGADFDVQYTDLAGHTHTINRGLIY